MKIVVAPDSFKESMTASEVCHAIKQGISKAIPDAEITTVPMADGGEGTTEALIDALNGEFISIKVQGPLGNQVKARYGLIDNRQTAVIEVAQASGLTYVPSTSRSPQTIKNASTYGVGQLMIDALNHGVKKIILGLGGSCTNDVGAGMAQAIGVQFFDKNMHLITTPLSGGSLSQISKIDCSKVDPRLKEVRIILATDVSNPLTGKNGASYTFGKQKGADMETVQLLDQNLHNFAALIKNDLNKDIENVPGSGAAGGLGGGLLAFTNAIILPGVTVVANENHLEEKIKTADYVFTGEGGTDFQTKFGKTPYGVAKIAKKYNIPVISLAGYLGQGIDQLYDEGFTAIFGILGQPSSLDQALKAGPKNVERTCENIARLIKNKSKA